MNVASMWRRAPQPEGHLEEHAEGRAGGHAYNVASFGLDADDLRDFFDRYATRFGVLSVG